MSRQSTALAKVRVTLPSGLSHTIESNIPAMVADVERGNRVEVIGPSSIEIVDEAEQ